MTTKTKDYEALDSRRTKLVAEVQRLQTEGEAVRLGGDPRRMGEIKRHLAACEDELRGLVPDHKQARREVASEAATQLAADRTFQAEVLAVLQVVEPLAALTKTVHKLRGQNVAVPLLPPAILRLVDEVQLWARAMVAAGALDSATVPPELREVVQGEGNQ